MKKTTYRILAKDSLISNNSMETNLNNNDLIIGTSGCGKTRSYVMPNILQFNNESMIIADAKGSLQKEFSKVLEQRGYKICNINLMDCSNSTGYNPMDYIAYDDKKDKYKAHDIKTITSAIVNVESSREPFWEFAARSYLESLIGYVLECLPDEEHNLEYVQKLFSEMGTEPFAALFVELEAINPDSFAVAQYNMYKGNSKAERMDASIRGILAEKLSPIIFDGTIEMFNNPEKIDFSALRKEKTAVFVTISDTDRSMDKLASLFYTQAINILCSGADKDNKRNNSIPVRFILEDFATNVYIPNFDKIISMIRSRDIYVSIIIQSISQLNSLYGSNCAMTIINNCDNLLYLGGQDVETSRYISIKANKSINTILSMPLSKGWLFTRGQLPKQIEKYPLETHKNYKEIA